MKTPTNPFKPGFTAPRAVPQPKDPTFKPGYNPDPPKTRPGPAERTLPINTPRRK